MPPSPADDGREEFFPAPDGARLRYRRYAAAGQRLGAVACFHGIQSHAGWYDGSCRALAAAGFETFFFDRRGSGANVEGRGHATNAAQLTEDAHACLLHARLACPGVRLGAVAISWGGKPVLAALAGNAAELVHAAAFVAPGWRPRVGASLRQKLAVAAALAVGRPRLRLPIPLADPALFTANPARQRFIAEDPLGLRRATARLLYASREYDRLLPRLAAGMRMPCLLALAAEDRIIDNRATESFFGTFAAADHSVRTFPGHHTLEFEPDPQPFFAALVEWFRPRLARPA